MFPEGIICKLRRKIDPTPRALRTFDKVLFCVSIRSVQISRRLGVSISFTNFLLAEGINLSTVSIVKSDRFSGKLTVLSSNVAFIEGNIAQT